MESSVLYLTVNIVLQVLDSVNVDSRELADARNKFTGRLQKEMVEEYVGHKRLDNFQV